MAHFDFMLEKCPPESLDTFILNGCSAGALATYYWSDYLRKRITDRNPKVTFFGMPDSGWFFDITS